MYVFILEHAFAIFKTIAIAKNDLCESKGLLVGSRNARVGTHMWWSKRHYQAACLYA